MSPDLVELYRKAEIRNKSIPKRIERNRVYCPANPLATVVTTLVWSRFLRKKDVKGKENLDLAISSYSEKDPLTFAGPHVSDADTLYLEQGLRFEGYWGFANRLVYIAGNNMDERLYIRVNTWGGNRLFIETPLILEGLEQALEFPENLPSKEVLEEFLRNGKRLNFVASKEVVRARKRKQPLVLYPQSGRSDNGFIQKGHPRTEAYLKDGIILPFLIRGSENFLPPRVKFTLERIKRWLTEDFIVDLTFGEPFRAKDIWTPSVLEGLEEMQARPVDLVMARIGRLDWQRIDPRIREFHQALDERFPPMRLAT